MKPIDDDKAKEPVESTEPIEGELKTDDLDKVAGAHGYNYH